MLSNFVSSLCGQVSAYTLKVSRGRGWGDNFSWRSFEDGLTEATEQRKPLMVIVHRPNCPDCNIFRKRFASSKQMVEMSQHFVLVNAHPHELPEDYSFSPDGVYLPRVLFFTPRGYLMRDVFNPNRREAKYTYMNPSALSESMQQAMTIFTNGYTNQINSKIPVS